MNFVRLEAETAVNIILFRTSETCEAEILKQVIDVFSDGDHVLNVLHDREEEWVQKRYTPEQLQLALDYAKKFRYKAPRKAARDILDYVFSLSKGVEIGSHLKPDNIIGSHIYLATAVAIYSELPSNFGREIGLYIAEYGNTTPRENVRADNPTEKPEAYLENVKAQFVALFGDKKTPSEVLRDLIEAQYSAK